MAAIFWQEQTRQNIEELKKLIQSNAVIPFIGAGMSAPVFPTWKSYIEQMVYPEDKDAVSCVKSMLSGSPCNYEGALQYIYKRYGINFLDKTSEMFSSLKISSDQVNPAVFEIPFLFSNGPLITTNLDQTLEWVYKSYKIPLPVGLANDTLFLSDYMRKAKPCLWKIHGDVDKFDSWVLTTEQYEHLYGESDKFLDLFVGILHQKVLLFLGCSLESDKVVSLLEELYKKDAGVRHYAILPLDLSDSGFCFEEFSRLSNLGIKPIWYPKGDYSAFLAIVQNLTKEAGRRFLWSYTKGCPGNCLGYINRERELQEISNGFRISRFVILTGMSGIGKTQLAVRYLSSISRENIIYINSSSEEIFYYSIHDFLEWDRRLPEKSFRPVGLDYRKLFADALDEREHYIVFFDDVNDDSIAGYIAGLPLKGKYLITTHSHYLRGICGSSIEIEGMDDSQAAYLIKKHNPKMKISRSDSELKELNIFCGGIPLALEQAAVYMAETGESLRNYLRLVKNSEILKKKIVSASLDGWHKGIGVTFHIAYSALQEKAMIDDKCKTALNIMKWCAVLYPAMISTHMLCTLTGYDEIKLGEGISKILSCSFIQREGCQITLKELIQFLIQSELEVVSFQNACECVGSMLQKKFASDAATSYNIIDKQEFVLHAQWMISQQNIKDVLAEDTINFLSVSIAEYELMQGNLKSARLRLEHVVMHESIKSITHMNALIIQAFLDETEGRYEQALGILESMTSEQTLLKKKYPLRYLQWKQLEAYLYEDILMEKSASRSLRKAFAQLEICKSRLSDFEAAELYMELLNIKGHVCSQRGQSEKAVEMYQEVLNVGKAKFKENWEKIRAYIWAYGNLALLEMNQGTLKLKESIEKLRIQGKWMKKFYHEVFHPDMAYQKYSLGRCYYMQEEQTGQMDARVEQCFDEALEILDSLQIKSHPLAAQIHLQYMYRLISNSQYDDAYCHGMAGLGIIRGLRNSRLKTTLQLMLLIYTGHAQLMLEDCEGAWRHFAEAKKLLFCPNNLNSLKSFLTVYKYLFLLSVAKVGRFIVKRLRRR